MVKEDNMLMSCKLVVASLVSVVVAVCMLSGCSGTAGTAVTGKTGWDQDGAPTLNTQVAYQSAGLKGEVEIVNIASVRSGDLMMAQVTLRSREKDTLALQYNIEWFDLNGMSVNAASLSWKPLLLYGKDTKNIQGLAPDSRGRQFKLNLREIDK